MDANNTVILRELIFILKMVQVVNLDVRLKGAQMSTSGNTPVVSNCFSNIPSQFNDHAKAGKDGARCR